jgi:hypothetical protein
VVLVRPTSNERFYLAIDVPMIRSARSWSMTGRRLPETGPAGHFALSRSVESIDLPETAFCCPFATGAVNSHGCEERR